MGKHHLFLRIRYVVSYALIHYSNQTEVYLLGNFVLLF